MLMKTRSVDDAGTVAAEYRDQYRQATAPGAPAVAPKRSGIQLGTKTMFDSTSGGNVATAQRTITVPPQPTSGTFSPQARRARAVASRQRRLTDSMVLEEASDTYLRAFSEQVTRLKRLTDGLQRLDGPEASENGNHPQHHQHHDMDDVGQQQSPMKLGGGGGGRGEDGQVDGLFADGRRSNWPVLSSSLNSGYRFRSSSTSAAVDRRRLPPLPASLTTSNINGPNKNGDAVSPRPDPEWRRAAEMSVRPPGPPVSMPPHKAPPSSANLPNAHDNSFYEGGGAVDESPYGHRGGGPPFGTGGGQRYPQANGGVPDRFGAKFGNHQQNDAETRCAAPLAKPEPLAELEKPAFDNSHYAKQAATAAPQARRFGSSTIYTQHQQHKEIPVHQKTIRFADEEDFDDINPIDDDPGIMSEAETSATSGSNSAVRRRQFFQQPKRQDHAPPLAQQSWAPAESMTTTIRQPTIGGDRSPSMVHRPLVREGVQHQQQQYQQHLNVPPAATLTNSPKSGVVFLQFQGETKRSVLPVGQDGMTKSALHTMDDVRILFLKAFQSEMSPEYLQSSLVKIYIQDPTKTDVFYELDDLNDVKDRSILKLHECRPNSPPPVVTSPVSTPVPLAHQPMPQSMPVSSTLLSPPTEHRRVVSPMLERAAVVEPNLAARASPRLPLAGELRGTPNSAATIGNYQQPHHYHQHQTSTMADDMNYFSEPEFDTSGDYRLKKSSSTSNYGGGISGGYPSDQRRHYGTIDRCYGAAASSGANRATYRTVASPQVPPKPERHFGPGVPSGGRTSMRRSQSPPRVGVPGSNRPAYGGHSTDPEDAYGVRSSSSGSSYRDYAPSPTSDMLMEALYNRPPSVSRSGSVTPVIDEEARIRMINMEKQLANLSSLVHSALMTKGGNNETVYKDLEMLRREILGGGGGSLLSSSSANGTRDDISDSGSVCRFSDISSEKGSYVAGAAERDVPYPAAFAPINTPTNGGYTDQSSNNVVNGSNGGSNGLSSPEAKHTLKTCKRRVGEIQTELKNLRRLAQLNAQSSRDILKDAFDRIKVILNTNKHLHMFAVQAQQQNQAAATGLSSDRNWADQEQERFRKSMQRVEHDLIDLEKQVEGLRQKVINGERKLRMTEVESFTDALGQIGRLAAHLKTNFPMLQDRLKQVMSAEMEKVVREEKFLKDEPNRVDTALKRCKKLTNTMVTMKKLAMVQDPAAYYGAANRTQPPVKPSGALDSATPGQNGTAAASMSEVAFAKPTTTSPVAPSPTPKPAANGSHHVLDSLLEELQNVAKTAESANAALTNGGSLSSTPLLSSTNGTDKNGGSMNGAEKRVGFADEVQVLPHHDDPNESDTIKRAPKLNGNGFPNSPQANGGGTTGTNGYGHKDAIQPNSILANRNGNGLNGHPPPPSYGHHSPYGLGGSIVGSRRRSASPMATTPGLAGFNIPLQSTAANRSHSGTPSSITSDPSAYQHHPYNPPPPPPRSSSRTMLAVGGNGHGSHSHSLSDASRFKNFDLDELKQQLLFSPSNGKATTPTAMVQTNAVDDEPRLIKSASSSESVNSQDGHRQRHHQHHQQHQRHDEDDRQLLSPPGKPPPPPPPPRNKQEMLEQRQHELLTKQLQQQQQQNNNRYAATKYQL